MVKDTNTELFQVIQHLDAMTATLQGLSRLLRKMAARPWPELPNGEGIATGACNHQVIAGAASAGIFPVGSICACGHFKEDHKDNNARCLRICSCEGFTTTLTDPRD